MIEFRIEQHLMNVVLFLCPYCILLQVLHTKFLLHTFDILSLYPPPSLNSFYPIDHNCKISTYLFCVIIIILQGFFSKFTFSSLIVPHMEHEQKQQNICAYIESCYPHSLTQLKSMNVSVVP